MAQGPYAGDLSAKEAWAVLERDPASVLVDVRTDAEWSYVGVPDVSALGKRLLRVQWQTFPTGERNPAFADQLAQAGIPKDASVLFICRSGARSRDAAIAMTQRGYAKCFNVAGGFEGPMDEDRHRGGVDGWKAAGLPWMQS